MLASRGARLIRPRRETQFLSQRAHPNDSKATSLDILRTWWPLGAKQLLVFVADPVYIAFIMRMSHPDLELGALYTFGWPFLLLIAAPSFTLNALGNVFGNNVANVRRTRFVAMGIGIVGAMLLSVVAFTPLASFLMSSILGVPEAERPMVRTVLQVLTMYPVLKSICMISQGHLIRGGRSYEVLLSRVIRLVVGLVIIVGGYELRLLQGGVLGAAAILGSLGAQTIYLWAKSTQVRTSLQEHPIDEEVANISRLLRFVVPMSIAPIIGALTLLSMAAALGRLPGVVASLAVWPVVTNFNQIGVSLGKSFDQVTIVHGADAASRERLRRFGLLLGLGTMVGTAGLNASGLLDYLMQHFEALDVETTRITGRVMWILTPMPLLLTLCAYYRGLLARAMLTLPILGSKIVELVLVAAVLFWSFDQDPEIGIYAVATATVFSAASGLAYLWFASRGVRARRCD